MTGEECLGQWGPVVGVGGHKYLLLAGVSLYNDLAAAHDPILIFVRIIPASNASVAWLPGRRYLFSSGRTAYTCR